MSAWIRINGTAPAWPVLLEKQHPFYSPDNPYSLASASYSICGSDDLSDSQVTKWEILVDAGHQTVQFLLENGNRIPDAIVLTHGHPDHILGVDWIVQSRRFRSDNTNPFPIYCSTGVWNGLMRSYAHIKPYVVHRKLFPGVNIKIEETEELSVTAFPVYHGDGAPGASLLLFSYGKNKPSQIIITGDLLCPLLRKRDYELIAKSDSMFIDTNNLFPNPDSNHISFTGISPDTGKTGEKLTEWFGSRSLTDLVRPHLTEDKIQHPYFEEFVADWNDIKQIPHTIVDFARRIHVPNINLVHYWGVYDELYYNKYLLSQEELKLWANSQAKREGIDNSSFFVPKIGEKIYFYKTKL